jgi:hypothetical protein
MIEEARKKLSTFSLPAKPQSFGEQYIFPESVDKVSSNDLGSWMFKLAAWKGYAIKMMADVEIDRAGYKSKHDNRLARKISQSNAEGLKATKDSALGALLIDDKEFQVIRQKLTIKEAEVDSLKQVVEIYSFQVDVISREISRRALDVKMKQLGITNIED